MKDPILLEDLQLIAKSDVVDWSSFDGKTFFVTGATGYIGSFLVRALSFAARERGLDIRILSLVRNLDKARMVFGTDYDNVFFVTGDVTNPISIDGPVDYIFHAASQTSSKLMVDEPCETILTTLRGTENIVELSREKRIRGMVFLSSMEVYGVPDQNACDMTEEKLGFVNPLLPRSSYPESKRMAECLCAAAAHEFGLPVVIARLAQTFGSGVSISENRVFAQFAKAVMTGNDIVLNTDGSKSHCYCYIRDVVVGLLMLLTKGRKGEAYNLSNESTFCSIREMAEQLISTFPESGAKLIFDIPTHAEDLGYPPSCKMRMLSSKMRMLGWCPTVGLAEMYERMIESMKISRQNYFRSDR